MTPFRRVAWCLVAFTFGGWVAACTSDLNGPDPNEPDPNTPSNPSAASLGIRTEPGTGASGASLSVQPVIEVYDAGGALLTSDNQTVVTASLVASGGTLEGSTSVRAESGVATFTDLAVRDTVGQWSLAFSATDLPAITSAAFTLTPGAASPTTSVVTVSAAAVGVGGTVDLSLRSVDAEGNDRETGGLSVAFSTSGGTSQGTIGAVTGVGDGTYSATFTATSAGTATTVAATVAGEAVTTDMPSITVTSDDPPPPPPPPAGDTIIGVPLMDMTGTYQGFEGGLYPGGINTMPQAHLNAGINFGAQVDPLDGSGVADPNGQVVMMSLGMSNTRDHWNTFMADANADSDLGGELVLVQGAQSGKAAADWEQSNQPAYSNAAGALSSAGVTEEQVQVLWLLQANKEPTVALPSSNADAFELLERLGNIVRSAKTVYPNLKQIFFSSRIYSCTFSGLNPEPYAYESGFAVKWLIEAQIDQKETGAVDPTAGDLDYDSGIAPWLAWGTYLWADGTNARSDGLEWEDSDLRSDCTHPSDSGTAKSSALQLEFFKASSLATPWFLEN